MSKICVKCGNVIPDGMDTCPNCGRDEYDDSDLQTVLSELGLSLDQGRGSDLSEDDGSADQEPTIRIPTLELDDDTKSESTDVDEDADDSDQSKDAPKKAPSKKNETPADASFKNKPKKKPADKPLNPSEKEPAHKSQHPKKKPDETSARPAKRRPLVEIEPLEEAPQKRSAAVIGIVIGLIIALLVLACGIAFMLYQMGFFTQMSDEDLLNAPQTGQMETASVPETDMQPMVPDAAPNPAASEFESSALEAPALQEGLPEEEPIECTNFTITGTEYIILYSRGVTTEISYIIEPSDLRDKITWESSDENVATVDSYGTIRARRGGTCVIRGTCGDKSIKAYVTNDFTVPDTVVDMNMEDITLTYEGQTAELAVEYELTKDQLKALTWESSDPKVAMVDDDGVVTAIANGTAVITATLGDYTATCIVRCVNVTGNRGVNNSESEYVINYKDVTLSRKGEYFQLTLKSILGNEVPKFTWSSDDPDVATVDSKGVVTAVSNGTAYITTSVGQDKFQCIVRVNISG